MTPTINQWAQRHGVSQQALNELRTIFGMDGGHQLPDDIKGRSESAVQAAVRREAAQMGVYLYRNNVGALIDSRGIPVRFGLANDSKELNAKIKSGDLIGIRPVTITSAHVGSVIGQFVSREVKEYGWRYAASEREQAQLKWAQLIVSAGGDACFCAGVGTL